jgi:hypothetical protein
MAPHCPLLSECDTIIKEVKSAPCLRDAIQRRNELKGELAALNAAKTPFKMMAGVGTAHKAAVAAVLQQPLSEEDYLTLAGRHESLLRKVRETCKQLADAENHDALATLGAKLDELEALDVSTLPQSLTNDPVPLPVPPAPITTSITTNAGEGEEDWSIDPVYAHPVPEEGEEDWANDSVYVEAEAYETTVA